MPSLSHSPLHHVAVASCRCCILLLLHHVAVASCRCCILSLLHPVAVASCRCCIMSLLHHVAVASCRCCIMSLLHHVAVASCRCCRGSLAQIFAGLAVLHSHNLTHHGLASHGVYEVSLLVPLRCDSCGDVRCGSCLTGPQAR